MGINIKNNYGTVIDNHDGGVVNLHQGKNGSWIADYDSNVEEVVEVEAEEVETEVAESAVYEKIVKAINVLTAENLIKHKYDYAWVMQVMNETEGMPSYDSPQSFLTHMTELHIDGLPDISNINKELGRLMGKFPDWTFIDKDTTESNRRINIAKRFCNAFRKET